MRKLQSFIIFSLFDNKLPLGMDFKTANGCYKGETETSFIVSIAKLKEVMSMARIDGQESVLIVDNNSCYLRYTQSSIETYVGEWSQIDQLQAEKLEAYTELDGKFFTAK